MAATDMTTSGTTVNGDSQRGGKMISKVRESAAAQLSTQKNKATEGIGTVAQAVRQSTQQLRDQQHETLAGYVESAADQVERFSQRLRDKDVGELLEDAQQLARKQPAVFIGSAFVAGLLGVRFLKSSARDDRESGGRFSGSDAMRREHGSTVTSYAPRQQATAAGRAGGARASGTSSAGYAAGASGTEVVGGASGPERTSTEGSDKRNSGTGGSRPGGSGGGGRTPRSGKEKT